MSMSTSGSNTNAEDPWGQPSSQIPSPSQRVPTYTALVPEDWDEDEDEEEEQDPQALWETANSRAPMPQIQPSSTSTSAGTQLPPAAAFEAPLRILKRPSTAGSKSPSPLDGQMQKPLKEREAQYQAARERIFGEEPREHALEAANNRSQAARNPKRPNVVRDPVGPASGSSDGEVKRGFHTRRKKAGYNTSMDPGEQQEAMHGCSVQI